MKFPSKILMISTFLLFMVGIQANAQSPDSIKPVIFETGFDENPEPPGGMQGYVNFLSKNIHYPDSAINHGVQGTVYVSIIVTKDGSLKDIHVKNDKVGFGCAEEAVRVIKLMGKWKPGKIAGEPVNVRYTIPVKYVLH